MWRALQTTPHTSNSENEKAIHPQLKPTQRLAGLPPSSSPPSTLARLAGFPFLRLFSTLLGSRKRIDRSISTLKSHKMGLSLSKTNNKATKRARFMTEIEPAIHETLRRRSVVPAKSDIPTPFTNFHIFSEEWNLCGKYDSSRRVNVVSDLKLQRKKLPHLLVDKCVKQIATESIHLVRNELEMLMFIVKFAQLNIGFMHPNVIQLRGYYSFRQKIHVFVEFCELGNLQVAYITDPSPLLRINCLPVENEVRDFMRQIVSAVAYLHSNGIAHCDLAMENIFVTSQNILKIGDFDHAVFVGPENQLQRLATNEPLRRNYGAPEIYSAIPGAAAGAGAGAAIKTGAGAASAPSTYGDGRLIDLLKVDVWALGIILIKLYTKKPMFDSTGPEDKGFQLFLRIGLRQYLRAMYIEQSAICKFSDEMLDLVDKMLLVDPMKRISAAEALTSVWLQQGVADEQDVQVDA